MIKNKIYILTWTIITLLFVSCSTTRMQEKRGIILRRNIVRVDNRNINKDDLTGFIRQKPNKKVLGLVSFKVWFYELNQAGRHDNWFKRWLRNRVGEPPVILDSTMTVGDGGQMLKHLHNKGYFNATVTTSIKHIRKKKANVIYSIKTGKPYKIRQIRYDIKDTLIRRLVFADTVNSLLNRNDNLDSYDLSSERDRITRMLKNKGFFLLSKEVIRFTIDSSLNTHQADVNIIINGATSTGNDLLTHKQFRIRNFTIYPDFENLSNPNLKTDTAFTLSRTDKLPFPSVHKYSFLQKGSLRIKPQSILNSLLLNGGDLYSLDLTTQSYDRLSDLAIFRYVNIDFKPVLTGLNPDSTAWLDCNIQMMRNLAQSNSFEFEGTNNGGRLGLGGNLVYRNLNFFRGGETFYITLNGAAEMQQSVQQVNPFLFFNTFETGVESGLSFPKLLLPLNERFISHNSRPKTTFQIGFHMQERPDYKRYITNISMDYDWKSSNYVTHSLIPIQINSVRLINPSAAFTTYLNGLDPRFRNQYTDHLIWALQYSFLYNDQQLNRTKNFTYFRFNAESSGNTLNLFNNILNNKKNDEGYRTLLNIRYAQYVRSDVDFRYYNYQSSKRVWVFRAAAGIGLPYGNSNSLPFEKAFFAGGANDMRGWILRSLGPGGYYNPANRFDKTGDIQLESNIEYKFPIYDFINGGLFCDAGNIWLLNPNQDFPNGEFTSHFLKQVAVDAGLGFRFDFSFFVFRLDAALPLRYPYLRDDRYWVDLTNTKLKNIVWQFALGYPFQ
ncbi:MAG: BamA/TamA family outer membrane protein [Bacteroidota bacterium]|nr:BamA/TamA family outer membrane protein [Bacteroidota bacterium]